MAFLLGIWIWDHYFGKPAGYPPGTERIALVKIDRELRLADAMATDPAWLRWLAGAAAPEEARDRARAVLLLLAKERALGPAGLEALAMLRASQEGMMLDQALAEVLGISVEEASAMVNGNTRLESEWWQSPLMVPVGWSASPPKRGPGYEGTLAVLRTRVLAANGTVLLIGLAGLAFVPGAVRQLRRGLSEKPGGYGGAWPPAMGLVIFMAAILAWIGFTTGLSFALSAAPAMPAALVIALDSAARLLPALIAVGLLFRRPSHAARVMGLGGRVFPGTVLGLFSLLMVIDLLLRQLLHDPAGDPTGGLSRFDAGLAGLAFAVISACLVAPVAEETLYRGVLFRSLGNRLGVLAAAAISAVVFALLHFYDGYGFASVAVFGFSCATFYAATRSLLAVIVLHSLYNASIKIPEWVVYHAPLG